MTIISLGLVTSLISFAVWFYFTRTGAIVYANRASYGIWIGGFAAFYGVITAGWGVGWLLLIGSLVALVAWLAGLLLDNKTMRDSGWSWLWPVGLVLLLRTFVYEPYQIPSSSMEPNLVEGDYILVNRFASGLRPAEFGLSPLFPSEMERGDVIVFYSTEESNFLLRTALIKRVIGLPGDRIQVASASVSVNGQWITCNVVPEVDEPYLTEENIRYCQAQLDDRSVLLGHDMARIGRKEGTWIVPQGHYFVMGDNRTNSRDSRYWGTVPEANILGRADYVWMWWRDATQLPDFTRMRRL